jgi:hypothetical protein
MPTHLVATFLIQFQVQCQDLQLSSNCTPLVVQMCTLACTLVNANEQRKPQKVPIRTINAMPTNLVATIFIHIQVQRHDLQLSSNCTPLLLQMCTLACT